MKKSTIIIIVSTLAIGMAMVTTTIQAQAIWYVEAESFALMYLPRLSTISLSG